MARRIEYSRCVEPPDHERDLEDVEEDVADDVEEATVDLPASSPDIETTGVARGEERSLVGEQIDGRYQIVKRLGRGGMGEVYLAEHISIEKPVAIKLLRPAVRETDALRKRFLREARAASMIRHEHVVDITDFGAREDGLTYFVMEYLEGEDLSALLAREAPLPWRRARAISLQILRALAAAHAKGVVHRDMKPANCFRIRRFETDDFIKVLDFGIAKRSAPETEAVNAVSEETTSVTEQGAVVGTAAYMPPEQALALPLDARADLYAFGVMLYRMLSGALPFTGPSPMAVIAKHLHESPPPLRSPAASRPIPPPLAALVESLLAKEPERRPASATAVIEALEQLEGGDDDADAIGPARSWSGAREPSAPARRWRAALPLALALLIGGGVTAFLLRPPPRDATPSARAPTTAPRDMSKQPVEASGPARDADASTSSSSGGSVHEESAPAPAPDLPGDEAPTADASATSDGPKRPSLRAQLDQFTQRHRRAIRACFDGGGEFRTELRARVRVATTGRLESLELRARDVELRTSRCLEELFKKKLKLEAPPAGTPRARTVELKLRR